MNSVVWSTLTTGLRSFPHLGDSCNFMQTDMMSKDYSGYHVYTENVQGLD